MNMVPHASISFAGTVAMPWPGRGVPRWLPMDRLTKPAATIETEQSWAAQARAGHPEAFDRLVEAYSARIYTHLYRLVRIREEAEDLTQETFIRAYRFLHQFDGRRPFRNWLYTIATNVGLNALRSRQRRVHYESNKAGDEDVLATAPSPADPHRDAELDELRSRLARAIETLPPQAAMLMHLFYYEGLSVQEAAEIAGMNETAAKVTLHRARKRLRELLVDRNDV